MTIHIGGRSRDFLQSVRFFTDYSDLQTFYVTVRGVDRKPDVVSLTNTD